MYDRFGCNYLGYGNHYTTGNIQTLTGQTGSIATGKTYSYLYKQPPDGYNEKISAKGGTIFFESQEGIGRAVNYGGPSNSYRTIHATFIFSAVRGGATAKNELMQIYMDYLSPTPQAEEGLINDPLQLSISPNPFSEATNLRFTVSQYSHVRVTVYNIAGQIVNNLVDKSLQSGNHQIIWQGDDNYGKKLASGTYILRIETGKEIINRVVVVVN